MMTRKYLLKKDPKDLRDPIYSPSTICHAAHLPLSVDLRSKFGQVFDQAELGSCSANAGAAALAYALEFIAPGNWVIFARLFIYLMERELEGTVREDSGATLRDLMTVLNKNGACLESEDPYVTANFAVLPTANMIQDALANRVSKYHRITSLVLAKAALAEGLPVIIGMTVFESMESEEVAKTGIVPMPRPKEEVMGGHAVLVVGYDESKKCLLVRNSWGLDWGIEGYFWLPYGFWGHGYINDAWTIQK